MSHTYIRNLTFQTKDLGKEATLLLTFDHVVDGIYEDYFPVVWRVVKFGKSGLYSIRATYTSQLAFSAPQIVDGNIVNAFTCVQIKDQESTILTEAHNVLHFSDPRPRNDRLVAINETSGIQGETNDVAPGDGYVEAVTESSGIQDETYDVANFSDGGYVQAVNNTGEIQDIVLGFMTPGDLMPKPTIYFKDVGDGSQVTATFTPILRVYLTSDYQEGQILEGVIGTPQIWEQNLSSLHESTTWDLKRNPETGHYTITQAK